jgi:DNA modification methylase
MAQVLHGDCLEVLKTLPDDSIDSIVTDPPAGIAFMGKDWDKDKGGRSQWIAWMSEVAAECLRVIKPGGHALVWAIPRTSHWTGTAWEDAGWEARDKSADVSKMIDQQEKRHWDNICNAIDKIHVVDIIKVWKEYLKTVSNAGLSFLLTIEKGGTVTHYESIAQKNVLTQESQDQSQKNILIESSNAKRVGKTSQKSQIEIGINTQKNDFAPEVALLKASQENSDALAIIAELNLIAPHLTSIDVLERIAQGNAEAFTKQQQSHVKFVDKLPQSQIPTHWSTSIVLVNVKELLNEKIKNNLKAVEALKIWLGSKPSLKQAATSALCVALTEDLKHIILSQSKTFLNLDTTRQMDCVSAITVTITEYIAECLILFMANTLKKEAVDKAAGAEREVVGENGYAARRKHYAEKTGVFSNQGPNLGGPDSSKITAPATPSAKQWEGWGTALKPAIEEWWLFRKPLAEKTVASNVLEHGTGALNIDGCRVGTDENDPNKRRATGGNGGSDSLFGVGNKKRPATLSCGRFPAHLIHDGSDEVLACFPERASNGRYGESGSGKANGLFGMGSIRQQTYHDSGSAARFFYCAKASKRDRDEGLDGFELSQSVKQFNQGMEGRIRSNGTVIKEAIQHRNHHPTVKPTELMRYLCRLITPPGGTILDPFCGSGSTGKGAVLEGFNFIGIDQDPEYVEIARARIAYVSEPVEPTLEERVQWLETQVKAQSAQIKKLQGQQLNLFAL